MQEESKALAVFQPSELDLITNTVAKGANKQELDLFLYVAGKRGLNPLTRQIHFVKRGDQGTIQTGIDGFRLIAQRTGQYAPSGKPTIFEYDSKGKLVSATVFGNKLINGTAFEFSGTAFFDEYVPRLPNGKIFPMWEKMPKTMLEKCAEAKMLRKGFPEELSGLYSDEEMQQADTATSFKVLPAYTPQETPENYSSSTSNAQDDDDVICPTHNVSMKPNKWGGYSHATDEKKDGKTVWCNWKKEALQKAIDEANNQVVDGDYSPVPDGDPQDDVYPTSEAPEKQINQTDDIDWGKKTQKEFFEEMDRVIAEMKLSQSMVKVLMTPLGFTKRTEITIAKRNDVLKALKAV